MNTTLATLLLEQETKEPAHTAGQWLKGFSTAKEQASPQDAAARDPLKRHELSPTSTLRPGVCACL